MAPSPTRPPAVAFVTQGVQARCTRRRSWARRSPARLQPQQRTPGRTRARTPCSATRPGLAQAGESLEPESSSKTSKISGWSVPELRRAVRLVGRRTRCAPCKTSGATLWPRPSGSPSFRGAKRSASCAHAACGRHQRVRHVTPFSNPYRQQCRDQR